MGGSGAGVIDGPDVADWVDQLSGMESSYFLHARCESDRIIYTYPTYIKLKTTCHPPTFSQRLIRLWRRSEDPQLHLIVDSPVKPENDASQIDRSTSIWSSAGQEKSCVKNYELFQ